MSQRYAAFLVAAIVILVILSILFLFRQNISDIFSPKIATEVKQNNISPTLIPTPVGPLLRTGSLVKEYDMKLLNEQAVVAKLKELNIFGREYLHTNTQTTGSKPLNEVHILLTEDSRNYGKFYGNNSHIVLFNGVVQIYFNNLDDKALSDPATADTILEESIGTLYTLRYPDVEKEKAKDFIHKVVKELKDDDVSIVITKK